MIVALLYQSEDGRRSAGIDRLHEAKGWRVELREQRARLDVHRTKQARYAATLTKAQALAREWVSR